MHVKSLLVLIYEHSDGITWNKWAEVCRRHSGRYISFKLPKIKNPNSLIGFVFLSEEDRQKAKEELESLECFRKEDK